MVVYPEPTVGDIAPLLQSRLLAYSLVIIASHQPPEIPHIAIPTVRILRLSNPLAIENDGAVRLVNVLEWAERVARVWRTRGGSGVIELTEETEAQENLAPPPMFRFGGSRSTPPSPGPSPGSSMIQLVSTPPSPSQSPSRGPSPLSIRSIPRPRSMSSGRIFTKPHTDLLPPVDPTQRAFDALINFVPPVTHDKGIFKHALLVTTISRPFLTAANVPAGTTRGLRHTSPSTTSVDRPVIAGIAQRRSFFGGLSLRGSTSSLSLPPTPPIGSGESVYNLPSQTSPVPAMTVPPPSTRAHLIHLIPMPNSSGASSRQRTALISNIEAFLLSFGFPASTISQSSSSDPPHERPRPYLMPTSVFSAPVPCPAETGVGSGAWAEWSVTDVLLSGALDEAGSAGSRASTGAGVRSSKRPPRAWIGGSGDLVILPGVEVRASALGTIDQGQGQAAGSYSDSEMDGDGGGNGYPFPIVLEQKGRRETGLPTPPESEESGEEKAKVRARRRTFARVRSKKRDSASTTNANVSESASASVSGSGSGSEKSSKIGWRFWKKIVAK